LADNDLIDDNTNGMPIQTLADQIRSGYASGSWNGTGITSAVAQSQSNSPHKTALGYAVASSLGIATFDAQAIAGSSLLVRYTWSGDANLDGLVNALDFNLLASNFGGVSHELWYQGDFNYDGLTNTVDFNALAQNFNQPLLAAPGLGALIPEPAAAILPTISLLARRRRINR
jgi:hypothetical protein